ncbi:hypothetical protein ACFX13_025187 [Malus domestica]
MSLRSVLRKLGTNRSTYSNIRSAVLGASQSAAVNNNFRNPEAKPVSSVESSAGYCCHHVSDDGYLAMQSRTTAPRFPCSGQEFDYYINLKGRGLEAARFATQEFNKQKNAQLQFVRMLCANRRRLNNGPHYMYFILLEAMDGGELKVYQAHVSPDFTGGMSLQFLGRVVEKGSPVKLFDPLANFIAICYLHRVSPTEGPQPARIASVIDVTCYNMNGVMTLYGSESVFS